MDSGVTVPLDFAYRRIRNRLSLHEIYCSDCTKSFRTESTDVTPSLIFTVLTNGSLLLASQLLSVSVLKLMSFDATHFSGGTARMGIIQTP